MRLNSPVTNTEFVVSDTQTIISTTDLKGNITYANPYFIEASGFTEAELIGAPQNILRHPDMPAVAFADMWSSIKSGLPWTGIVKNRRKNGDFYWVQANVTPVMENGAAIGYMSVRTKPTRDQIAAASALYQKAANGARLRLKQGRLVRPGLLGVVTEALRFSTRTKVAMVSCLLLALTAFMAGISLFSADAAAWSKWLGAAALGEVLLIGGFWSFLAFKILRPLRAAAVISQRMGGGDMTATIETDRTDEIGQLLRSMRQMNIVFRSIIGDVRDSFDQMQETTRGLAAGNQDLSTRTDSQAAALEETAASMEEVSSVVQQNADRSKEGDTLARSALATAEKGGKIMQKVVSTISDISASSGKISEIVVIINGIAQQTNLLALNAAVEAARAGEAGRGFAVVASEVRALAQRCAVAATEIKGLVDTSTTTVGVGATLARDAGATMKEIIAAVNQVTVLVNDVATASVEQSSGISQINQAVTEMDAVTQQNANLVDEANKTTSGLEESVRKFKSALDVFKLSHGPSAALPAVHAAAAARPVARKAA